MICKGLNFEQHCNFSAILLWCKVAVVLTNWEKSQPKFQYLIAVLNILPTETAPVLSLLGTKRQDPSTLELL